MSFYWLLKIFKENWPMFLRGAKTTLYIALVGTILGSIIGLLVGLVRTLPKPQNKFKAGFLGLVNIVLNIYIELFRGTPMIVQAMVIYFGFDLDKMFAAILVVSINTGAYMAEIVRGGILSVDKGQFEGAKALGMSHMKTMRYVVIPQLIRNILPATGNEFVINIKDTSVLNVISVTELFFQSKSIAGNNFRYFESFFIASVIYLIMTLTVTKILRLLEKKLDGDSSYVMMGN